MRGVILHVLLPLALLALCGAPQPAVAQCPGGQTIFGACSWKICFDCNAGKFKAGTNCNPCASCEAGKYSGVKATSCRDCPAGSFNTDIQQDSCTSCLAGTYQNATGQTSCISCLAGTYQDQAGQPSCKACAEGTVQPNTGQNTCQACKEGTFANTTGLTTCLGCPAGTYTDTPGQSQCKACDLGFYQPSNSSLQCLRCAAGNFSDTRGATICKTCRPGTFQNSTGQSSCLPCPAGSISTSNSSTFCTLCSEGTSQSLEGNTTCNPCAPGTYQDQKGRVDCKACGTGTFQPESGKDLCNAARDCQPGTQISVESTPTSDRQCQLCPAGKFSSTKNTACQDCAQGFFAPDPGSSSCQSLDASTNCVAGTYISKPGNSTSPAVCSPCPAGTYSANRNQQTCETWTVCPAGTRVAITPTASRDRTCTDCTAGTFSTTTNAASCTACDPVANQYQNLARQTSCRTATTCLAGTFISTPLTSSSDRVCANCDGTSGFTSSPNQPSCTALRTCSAGTYISRASSPSNDRNCTSCQLGVSFSTTINSLSCTAVALCNVGEGNVQSPTLTTDRVCGACTAGVTFSDEVSGNACKAVRDCAAGQEEAQAPTVSRDRVCRACASNFYKSSAGSTSRCQQGTDCFGNTEVVPLTPTSDRQCEALEPCTDGFLQGGTTPCTCPGGASCTSCLQQNGRDGILLERKNSLPSSTPVNANNECIQLPLNNQAPETLDLVTPCRDLCRNHTNCAAFFIFKTGAAAGRCCLKSGFQKFDDTPALGGEFYSLQTCSICAEGFTKQGLGCEAQAQPPAISPKPPSRITVPITLPVGTVLLQLQATPSGNFGPVTYRIFSASGANTAALAINRTSGQLYLAEELTVANAASLTLEARDSRTACTQLLLDKVVTFSGGCRTYLDVVVDVAAFVSCPDPIIAYVPPTVSTLALTWNVPRLPSAFSDVPVSINLGANVVPPYTFPVGVTSVVYTSGNFTIGEPLVCSFMVTVRQGFAMTARTVGHLTTASAIYDLIIDVDRITGAGLALPRFQGQVLGTAFALGVQAPVTKPFSLNILPGYTGRLQVVLAWCTSGTISLTDTVPGMVSAPAEVTLAGANSVQFTNMGSGFVDDERCFRVVLRSQALTGTFSFSSIDISLDLMDFNPSNSASPNRRRSNSVPDYFPVAGSIVGMEYTLSNATITSDPGPMLVLQDVLPPVFFGCPLEPIQVAAEPGRMEANASWSEPTAVDNVGVVSTSASNRPGDSFSIIGSPHTVTYTASDAGGREASCIFQVIVSFVPSNPVEVQASMERTFTGRVRSVPFLGTSEVAYDIITPFSAGMSFTADLTNATQIRLRIATTTGDLALVRTPLSASHTQFQVDLTWAVDNRGSNTVPLAQDDIQVTLNFEGHGLDPTPSASQFGAATALPASQTLTTAQAAIDPAAGVVSVSAKSAAFRRGISFSALVLTLNFPEGRASAVVPRTLPETFFPTQASTLGFRFYYDAAATPTAADMQQTPQVILLDTVPPTVQFCPSNMTVNASTTASGSQVFWSEPIFTDNRPGLQVSTTHGSGSFFELLLPDAAPVMVTYTARDTFGNIATCTFAVQVVDVTPPTLQCLSPQDVVLATGAGTVTIPPAQWAPAVLTDNSDFPIDIVEPSGSLIFGVGQHEFTVSVADRYGNLVNCSTSFTIIDQEAPQVSCPVLNPVLGDPDTRDAEVVWSVNTPTDNDQVKAINSSIPSGSRFPAGKTSVTITVTDRSGNEANCTFEVQVSVPARATSDASANSGLVTGAAVGVSVLVLVLVVMAVMLRRAHIRNTTPQNWEEIFKLINQFSNRNISEDGVVVPRELPRDSLELVEELGKGAFGLVYKGLFREASNVPAYLVAVKSLHAQSVASERQELLEEAAITAQFSHKNVVQLVGVVTVGKPVLVVLEYCEYGSLKKQLEERDFDEKIKTMFAGDVAAGLEHIHEKGFVHRDVAARNVLVDTTRRCKIADFGLARDTAEDAYYRSRGGQLPVRWSAPEALDDRKFSEKTDVWSFGITCYEIWTRARMPYEGWHNQKVWVQVSAGYRLPQPEGCQDDVYKILMDCWAAESSSRPNFTTLRKFFRDRYTRLNNGMPLETEYVTMNSSSASSDGQQPNLLRRLSQALLYRLGSYMSPTSRTESSDDDPPDYLVPQNGGGKGRRKSSMAPASTLYDVGEEVELEDTSNVYTKPKNARDAPAMALYDMGAANEAHTDDGTVVPRKKTGDTGAQALYDMGQAEPTRKGMPGRRSSLSGLPSPTVLRLEQPTTILASQGRKPSKAPSVQHEEFGFHDVDVDEDEAADDADPDDLPISVDSTLMEMMASRRGSRRDKDREAGDKAPAGFAAGPISLSSAAVAPASAPSASQDLYDNVDTKAGGAAGGQNTIKLLKTGDRVKVQGYTSSGTVRYVGDHKEKGGLRYGIELDEPVGLNNGVVGGLRYFDCHKPPPGDGRQYGVLVAPSKVTPLMVPQAWV